MMENFGIFFSHSDRWPYLLLLPLLVGLLIRTARFRKKIIGEISKQNSSLFSGQESFIVPKARRLKNFLFVTGLALICLSSLGPQWGQKAQPVKAQGLDVCFALDLSRSMLAEDAMPSRLAQAKNQLSVFLPNLGGDRAALVGFAGSGFIAAPLSNDHSALIGFLDPMDPSFVSNQTTNIATGVDACLTALGLEGIQSREEISDSAAKLIVLISDGEDQFDDYNDAVKRCENLGIPIFAMAAGTINGSRIPIRNPKGELTGYFMKGSEPVVTKLEEKGLKEVVKKTGGKIFYLRSGLEAWKNFAEATTNYKRDSKDAGTKLDREERFQWPLLIGLLLLLLDFFIPEAGFLINANHLSSSSSSATESASRLGVTLLFVLGGATSASFSANAAEEKKILERMRAGPSITYQNNRAAKDISEGKTNPALETLEQSLKSDAANPILRFNWATAKLVSAVNKEGSVNPRSVNEGIRELEALKKDLNSVQNPAAQDLLKATHYQLGQAYQLIKDYPKAIDSYYRTLTRGRVDEEGLDSMAKKNISRLLTESQSQSSSGGGESDPNKGQNDGDNQKDGQQNGDKNPKQPEKDGADHKDAKQKPKYSGTEISEEEARQILESVTGEEREVQKRKAQGEANSRASKDRGQGRDNQGNQW